MPRPPRDILVLILALAGSAGAEEPAGPTTEDCLACHTDPTTRRTADDKPLLVDVDRWQASIHGDVAVGCTDCHADLAKAELPHADHLKPAQCVTCHEKVVVGYGKGVHARPGPGGKGVAAACSGCHGDPHQILASGDRRAPTHALNLVTTCARCHDDPKLVEQVHLPGGIVKSYTDSIHGRAVREAGLVIAPTCATCHGAHEVRAADDPASPVARAHQPATCGTCHEGILEKYNESIHAAKVTAGVDDAPVCISCHSAHGIRRSDEPAWKLEVIGECGTCHEESLRTYRDTFHGHVTELGFTRMAKCADCHGAHDIVARKDPRSRVAPENLVATCRTCHPNATPSFVQYDPHANARSPARGKALYYTAVFMKGLLASVFIFFGLHTTLWLARGLVDKVRGAGRGPDDRSRGGR